MSNVDMCEHNWPGSGCRECFPKPAADVPEAPGASAQRDGWRGGSSYEASMLRNLLARIHHDGGHYVEQHGLDKALEDADSKVVKWLARDDGRERLAADGVRVDAASSLDALFYATVSVVNMSADEEAKALDMFKAGARAYGASPLPRQAPATGGGQR